MKAASQDASSVLCSDIGKHWSKAAKAPFGKTTGQGSGADAAVGSGASIPAGYGAGCFVGSTLIQTPQGLTPIADLQPGNLVCAYQKDSGILLTRPIVATTGALRNTKHIHIDFEGGEVKVTTTHPFLTPSGFLEAGDLEEGGEILLGDGNLATIKKISIVESDSPVYNLQIDDVRTFIANGAVVHNTTITDGRVAKQMTKEEDDDEDEEESMRSGERDIVSETMRLAYCVSRRLGFDVETSLFAGCYAFTKL